MAWSALGRAAIINVEQEAQVWGWKTLLPLCLGIPKTQNESSPLTQSRDSWTPAPLPSPHFQVIPPQAESCCGLVIPPVIMDCVALCHVVVTCCTYLAFILSSISCLIFLIQRLSFITKVQLFPNVCWPPLLGFSCSCLPRLSIMLSASAFAPRVLWCSDILFLPC